MGVRFWGSYHLLYAYTHAYDDFMVVDIHMEPSAHYL